MSLLTGLVSYWKLDGNSNDATGAYNGADTSIVYSTGNGKINQGAGFNGTSSYISSTFTFAPTAFSMSWWIYPTTVDDYNNQVGAINNWGSFLCHTTNDGSMYCGTDVATRFDPGDLPGVYVDNIWQFITYTYDGTTGKFYKNGTLLATKAQTAPTTWGGVNFGNPVGANATIAGNLDEVGLWSRALSQAEVTQLYNGGVGLQYPFFGIFLETSLDVQDQASTTSLTYGYTITLANLLVVGVTHSGTSNLVSSVTYAGTQTMTQIAFENAIGSLYLYYLLNPTSGTHNVVITTSSSTHIYGATASYIGAYGLDNYGTNTQNLVSLYSTTLTTNADNCMVIEMVNQALSGMAAVTGTTSLSPLGMTNDGLGLAQQTINQTPAGTATVSVSRGAGSDNWSSIIASFAPFAPLTPATGAFTLTGINISFNWLVATLTALVGQFVLTGYDIILMIKGWKNQSKDNSSWGEQSKHSASYSNQTKDTATWTEQNKN